MSALWAFLNQRAGWVLVAGVLGVGVWNGRQWRADRALALRLRAVHPSAPTAEGLATATPVLRRAYSTGPSRVLGGISLAMACIPAPPHPSPESACWVRMERCKIACLHVCTCASMSRPSLRFVRSGSH